MTRARLRPREPCTIREQLGTARVSYGVRIGGWRVRPDELSVCCRRVMLQAPTPRSARVVVFVKVPGLHMWPRAVDGRAARCSRALAA